MNATHTPSNAAPSYSTMTALEVDAHARAAQSRRRLGIKSCDGQRTESGIHACGYQGGDHSPHKYCTHTESAHFALGMRCQKCDGPVCGCNH